VGAPLALLVGRGRGRMIGVVSYVRAGLVPLVAALFSFFFYSDPQDRAWLPLFVILVRH